MGGSSCVRFLPASATLLLDCYNVIEEAETAAALAQVAACLLTQPKARNVEVAQFGHRGQAVGAEVSSFQGIERIRDRSMGRGKLTESET